MKPLVIFLNGTSSAGKSSIARALQELYKTPLLHTGIDTLYEMLPEKSVGDLPSARFGYRYVMHNGVLDHIKVGDYAKRLLSCTVPMTEVLLQHKNDVVVDEILFSGEERLFLHAYADIFTDAQAYFIKIECPLEVLEAREALRPDRHQGVARLQYGHVHNHGYAYDFAVNTAERAAEECARLILEYVAKEQNPIAFAAVRARKKL